MKPLAPLTVALRGTRLIEASAGTGKTFTITTLYLRLLLEQRRPVDQILVVTYTNAATAELRTRVRARLVAAVSAFRGGGDPADDTLAELVRMRREHADPDADAELLIDALHSFDEAPIFTIHGFCQRLLKEHAFESGVSFETNLVTDQTALVDEVVRDYWARRIYAAPRFVVRHVLARNLGPLSLARLAGRVALHTDALVLPENVAEHVAEAEEQWRAAHARAREMWRAERDVVLALLERSVADLHAGSYKRELIPEWAARMDEELTHGEPGIPARWSAFERLASSTLEKRTRKGRETPAHEFFDACENLLRSEERLGRELDAWRLDLERGLVSYARHELRRRKEVRGIQFFDDLLHRVDEALAGPSGDLLAERIRARFPAALIDEFQDTDPVQYRIFRRALSSGAGGTTLFLIGDPKQAIYAFRGADVFAYIAAKGDAGQRTSTLETNWRADPSLVEAVNHLFRRPRAQFVFAEIPFVEARPSPRARERLGPPEAKPAALEILFVPREGKATNKGFITKQWAWKAIPTAVAADIARFLAAGTTIDGRRVEPSDIAVLCRKNAEAADMQARLRELGIPTVLQGDASVFDTAEAEELGRLLGAMADPGDALALRAALATPMLGVGAEEISALQEDERAWDAWTDRFQRWNGLWREKGFVPALRRMMDECGAQARLLALVDGERRLTNVLHLSELLQAAVGEASRGPLALVEWLAEMRRDAGARSALGGEGAEIRLESDEKALKLTTVHKSKGLEYPIVYCPFLWDGRLLAKEDRRYLRFHDPADGNRLKFDLGSADREEHERLAEREAMAESLRLLYVAVTRAKHRSVLVWGAFNDSESSALGYVFHQPPELAAAEDVAAATQARILVLDDDAMRADLDELARISNRTIEIRELSAERGMNEAPPYAREAGEQKALVCRSANRRLSRAWRVGSFSSLVSAVEAPSPMTEEAVDDDESVPAPAVDFGERPGVETVVLHDFPAGPRSGRALHRILECFDFGDTAAESIGTLVGRTLSEHGLDVGWSSTVATALRDIVDTALGGETELRLRDVPTGRRLNELEFVFPVGTNLSRGPGANREEPLDGARLASVLARHRPAAMRRDYLERVRGLGFAPLSGYLRGFVDLVFEHGGRWYVVDYKSNRLGPRPADYAPARLRAAMEEHHYYLQYLIYVVALDRYLTRRLAGYVYDRDFGGVFYLFLRGMAPRYAAGWGVFRDRPAPELIGALSALLAGAAAGGPSR